MIGIRTIQEVTADIVVTSSVVPVAVLTTPVPAGTVARPVKVKVRCVVPFAVGATGGVRAIFAALAGAAIVKTEILLVNTVAPSITPAAQVALNTAFTNALANAGDHWLQIDVLIENTGAAGSLTLQMAQNTSDALSLTIYKGGTMEVVQF